MSEITIELSGGKKVDVRVGGHLIRTDQPVAGGGEDSAPAPFDLFLASLGACAGFYVVAFCQNRNLSTEGIKLRQRAMRNPQTRALERVEITIDVPPDFPPRYVDALARAADQCTVKKAIDARPQIAVRTAVVDTGAAAPSRPTGVAAPHP